MLPVTTTAKPSILSIKFIELIIKITQSTDIKKFKELFKSRFNKDSIFKNIFKYIIGIATKIL